MTTTKPHAEETSRRVTFYLPGMFYLDGVTGKYPALSITGDHCALSCDHCCGKILQSMTPVTTPEALLDTCLRLADSGQHGVLLSGGCDMRGELPWEEFLPTIAQIKARTDLIVSVHCGLVDEGVARGLKGAGVDQALIDVIGDDATFQKIYHVPFGVDRIDSALYALSQAGLPMIPHIVCGINYGEIVGEFQAVDMLSHYNIEQLVFVSLMRIPGTPAAHATPPEAAEVAKVISHARKMLPSTRLSLGCARQRGNIELEKLALEAGVDRMALPSEEAVEHARSLGLTIRFQKTCCSVSQDISHSSWEREAKEHLSLNKCNAATENFPA